MIFYVTSQKGAYLTDYSELSAGVGKLVTAVRTQTNVVAERGSQVVQCSQRGATVDQGLVVLVVDDLSLW